MLSAITHGDTVHLGSVRCRGSRDAIRDRRRLEAAMEDVTGARVGLPTRALLIVRRIAPAAPLRGSKADRFANTVRQELARSLRAARRPWLDVDAASAEAVWFADEVELAACLIRDWLQGRVAERWWWKQVLGAATATEWWRRQVVEHGETFAAVTEKLGASGHVIEWYARFEDAHLSRARMAIDAAYGTRDLTPSMADVFTAGAALKSGLVDEVDPGSGCVESGALRALLEIVPEISTSTLSVERRALLATALAVRRQLHWTRSASFQKALQALRSQERAGADTKQTASSAPRKPATSDSTDSGESVQVRSHAQGVSPLPKRSDADPHPMPPDSLIVPRPSSAAARPAVQAVEAPHEIRAASPKLQIAEPLSVPASMRALPSAADSRLALSFDERIPDAAPIQSAESVAASAATRVADLPQPEGVQTSFGGILYLLNVALALGLYGDFTQPRYRGLELSPWDWLAVIGRHWFGRRFRKDSIWNVLADLAGRPARRRPGGVFDRAEMAEQVVTRLMQALGTDDPRLAREQVCRHPAHIYKSASQVDVHLSLDDLPIEIRIAGLDRDPGWIPAAGYSIRFHFQ